MSGKEVIIDVKAKVDGQELDDLNKEIKELARNDFDVIFKSKGLDDIVKEVSATENAAGNLGKTVEGVSGTVSRFGAESVSAMSNLIKEVSGAENATSNFGRTVEGGSGAWFNLKNSASGALDGILGGLESATSKMSTFLSGMSGAERIFTGVLGAVGVKSINDLTIANAKAANTNKILMNTMTNTSAEAKSLWNASDAATNSSLMSMRELVPVMSAFQAQTGANASQMELFAETTAKLGSKSLALGYSSEVTTTALMGMGNALDGSYQVLQKYGITEQKLKDTGKWSGDKKDLEGFMEAVQIATGDISELIDGIEGKEKQVFKKLSVAGREWGEELTPIIESIYDGFLGLNSATDGWVAKLTVGAAGAVSTFAMVAPQLEASFNVFGKISEKIGNLRKGVEEVGKVTEKVSESAGLTKHTSLVNANSSSLRTNTAVLKTNTMARVNSGKVAATTGSALSGGSVAKGLPMGATDNATKGIKQIGAVGAAARNAAPGATKGATGLNMLSGSLTSMIMPILKISAVIAIIIPIIAALAIEIAFFVRIVGEVIKVLRFDKLNLKPAIEGIKQISLAMWEILRAFTVLTALNMVNIVYTATGGIIGTTLALSQFWLAMKGIEAVLKDVNNLQIDETAVSKIQNLKSILNNIASAMQSMANLNLSGFTVWITGGVEALINNLKNLELIAKSVQSMNIPDIDNSKVEQIRKLAAVTKELAIANGAIKESLGWWNTNVVSIQDVEGMQSVLKNLGHITVNINDAVIPDVNPSRIESIKSIASVIEPMTTANNQIKESLGWWNTNVLTIEDVEGMQAVLRNLGYIAHNINSTDIPSVSKDKIDAIRNIENVIMPIVNSAKAIGDNWQNIIVTSAMATPFSLALDVLYIINQKLNTVAFSVDSSKIEAISNLKQVIQRVAEIGLYFSQNSGNIGSNITNNAENLSSSISSLYSVNQKINSSAFSLSEDKVTAMNNLKPFIEKVAEIGLYLSQNSGNLSSISYNKEDLSGAIQSLYEINQKINSMPFQIDDAKVNVIGSLNSLMQSIVSTLNAAANVQSAAQNMGSKITTGFKTGAQNLGPASVTVVTAAITAVQNRYATMQSAGNALGAALASGFKVGSGISSPMAIVVSGLNDTLSHIHGLTGSFYSAGEALGSAVQASYYAQNKSTTVAGYSKLINEVRDDVVSLFNSNSFNLSRATSGDIVSAAGGDFTDYKIEYPSNKTFVFNNNSLITEAGAVDEFERYVDKVEERNRMRS
ncbi:MAG: hypothetical protein LBE72_05315 [Rickettsia sp.]|jgi:hypothetical protein|nr:hypothetical protein [Rickettsia sp.]